METFFTVSALWSYLKRWRFYRAIIKLNCHVLPRLPRSERSSHSSLTHYLYYLYKLTFWQIQKLDIHGREGAIASAVNPVHYSIPSEIEISAIYNSSDNKRWFATDVYFVFLYPWLTGNGPGSGTYRWCSVPALPLISYLCRPTVGFMYCGSLCKRTHNIIYELTMPLCIRYGPFSDNFWKLPLVITFLRTNFSVHVVLIFVFVHRCLTACSLFDIQSLKCKPIWFL